MWQKLLGRVLDRIIQKGTLQVTWPDGQVQVFGDKATAPITITLLEKSLPRKLFLNPELAMAEAYMDETLLIGDDDLKGFLSLLGVNAGAHGTGRFASAAGGARKYLRRISQHNPLATARRNVEHHYDLSTDLYELFLDDDLQYTCAYFRDPDMSLEQAQAAKKAHIAAKLMIEPGMRVMDIGCGWGGLSITLARDYGARVTAVTLSQVQLDYARARAEKAGVADRIDFRLIDYRDVSEQFDRIVVVGMLEHVGQPQYATFFRKLRENLTEDGIALVHSIGRETPPGRTSPFIHKYIFPGGYIPAMSEVLSEIERTRLVVADVEVWRGHYAKTLRHWQARFDQNLDAISALYDDRFCRMWRYYLIAAEVGNNALGLTLFQFQISRQQLTVPTSRDYLYKDANPGD